MNCSYKLYRIILDGNKLGRNRVLRFLKLNLLSRVYYFDVNHMMIGHDINFQDIVLKIYNNTTITTTITIIISITIIIIIDMALDDQAIYVQAR